MNRRTFIDKTFSTTVLGSLLSDRLRASEKDSDSSLPLFAAVEGDPEKSVDKAFELLGGIQTFIKPGNVVLLKPNVSFPNPKEWGSTTSPEIIKAVAQLALRAGAQRVIVADNTMRQGTLCFDRCGLTETFAGMEKVHLLPIQQESFFEEIQVPNGKALRSVKIAKLVRKTDVMINMPCAKSHAATDVSFGLKNLMGLIWDRDFFHNRTDLNSAIAELATVIRPQLTILDATRAMLTAGPTGPGKVQELRTIVAGTDPLAVDVFAAGLASWNNRTLQATAIKHLTNAYALGVGKLDLKKVNGVHVKV